ncbi:MAG TPA: hypothetical protein VM818_12020 [Vicinamibacterales bacterium]|nr:hypothetical protein [Vicinamibacterales bacterium]
MGPKRSGTFSAETAMYGVLGVLHLYLARDVVRYLDLIFLIGWSPSWSA